MITMKHIKENISAFVQERSSKSTQAKEEEINRILETTNCFRIAKLYLDKFNRRDKLLAKLGLLESSPRYHAAKAIRKGKLEVTTTQQYKNMLQAIGVTEDIVPKSKFDKYSLQDFPHNQIENITVQKRYLTKIKSKYTVNVRGTLCEWYGRGSKTPEGYWKPSGKTKRRFIYTIK